MTPLAWSEEKQVWVQVRAPGDALPDVVDPADLGATLDRVEEIVKRSAQVLQRAAKDGDHRLVLTAVREQRANLELIAKLKGELAAGAQVNLNFAVLSSPEWVELRTRILDALQRHPEARSDVLAALTPGVDAIDAH